MRINGVSILFVVGSKLNSYTHLNFYATSRCRSSTKIFSTSEENEDNANKISKTKKVLKLAKDIVVKPINSAPMPQYIGAILRDAAGVAVEDVITSKWYGKKTIEKSMSSNKFQDVKEKTILMFSNAEKALEKAESDLKVIKEQVSEAKIGALAALAEVETYVDELNENLDYDIKEFAESNEGIQIEGSEQEELQDYEKISFEDIDYGLSEMAPPFIGEDMCLVPGVPCIRVEKAPQNSRRIFAGIDILASVDDVWNVLTDYENLDTVFPNLLMNEVLDKFTSTEPSDNNSWKNEESHDTTSSPQIQTRRLCETMNGAVLKQVGCTKVVGVNFSAKSTLEVREWPNGMPEVAYYTVDKYQKNSEIDPSKTPIERYQFPRPFAISKLPTKDISMLTVENDDGDFRIYQSVWRLQPLPGCAPPGLNAMRLTFAVEVSPRAFLPVRLIEGRIASELCANLEAIREYVAT